MPIFRATFLRLYLSIFTMFFAAILIAANSGRGASFGIFLQKVPMGDKLGHFVLLGIFSFLVNGVLRGRPAPGALGFMMMGSFLLMLGMSIEEGTQCLNPHRNCDVFDWLANLIGIIAGEVVCRRLGAAREPRPPSHAS